MKLTAPQKALSKTLAAAARLAAGKNTIPILAHLRLEAREGALTVSGTDLDIEATTRVEANVQAPGACCVPAGPLAEMVRKIDEKADVSIEQSETQIVVRAGRARFKLSTLPVEDWPDRGATDLPHSFEVPAKSLGALLDRTSFAISTEETRYYLNGVYLHVTGDADDPAAHVLRGVATDGHRLARFDMPAPDGAAGMPGVIVPRKTIEMLSRLVKDGGETIKIDLSQNIIRFAIGATTITSKLIDGTFPDYARVIPQGQNLRATIDGEALAAAVARVSTISSERGRAVKFHFSGDTLALSVTNPDMGDARDEIEVEWDGAPIEIGFNALYMQSLIAACGGGAMVMKMSDPGAPCVVTPAKDAAWLGVLMPMRV